MPPQAKAAPDTLPANFAGWDQAPDTLPANFSGFDDSSKQQQPGFWQQVKQAFTPRDPNSMPGAVPYDPNNVAMPGSFEGHPENIGEYIPASAGEMAGGVKDIAQGNIAKGGHRVIQGASAATLPALPFLGPLVAANPGLALRVAGGATVGGLAGQKGAEAFGATPDQSALAGDIGGLAGGYGGAKLPSFLSSQALKASAGESFNAARAAAGSNPVDVEGAGQAALDALDKAAVGRKMPVTMRKFIQRVTAPDAEPLSYDEARDFYQAAGELSANEKNGLTPSMQRLLNTYRGQLGQSIQQTADNAGVGSQYGQAMTDYAKAKRLEDTWDTVWSATKKNLVPGLIKGLGLGAGGAASYGMYRELTK